MAKRLIDAEAFERVLMFKSQPEDICDDCLQSMIDMMNEQPTVDAEPVRHGCWWGDEYDGYADGLPVYSSWRCSECGTVEESEGDPPPWKYCPHCGAKMDAEMEAVEE